MQTSLFMFASDLADEGVEAVLDRVQGAGVDGITPAFSYHEGRDIFPHNPLRTVMFHESGAAFFPLREEPWSGSRLRPPLSRFADTLPLAIERAHARGMTVNAWTVMLHNGAVAEQHPEAAPENVFGERLVTDLCPANPDARQFALTLTAEIAALGVDSILAESLHFHPIEHGYAHERYFVPLGPLARYLLGLCFCADCLAAGGSAGVDGERLRAYVREAVQGFLAGTPEPDGESLEEIDLESLAGGALADYAHARRATVSTLVADVAEAARAGGARFDLIDPCGAFKGYADGKPQGGDASTIAWRIGLDVTRAAELCDGYQILGYAADPARVKLDLDAYGERATHLGLRPAVPDCSDSSNLREKIDLAQSRGLERVDFYHYGLMPLSGLDLIKTALS